MTTEFATRLDKTYVSFVREDKPNRKTPIYHIVNKSNQEIGQIKWYPQWRKFCFFPNNETIWDKVCLSEVYTFLTDVNLGYAMSKAIQKRKD